MEGTDGESIVLEMLNGELLLEVWRFVAEGLRWFVNSEPLSVWTHSMAKGNFLAQWRMNSAEEKVLCSLRFFILFAANSWTCLSVLFRQLYRTTGLAYSLLFFPYLSHIIVTPTGKGKFLLPPSLQDLKNML